MKLLPIQRILYSNLLRNTSGFYVRVKMLENNSCFKFRISVITELGNSVDVSVGDSNVIQKMQDNSKEIESGQQKLQVLLEQCKKGSIEAEELKVVQTFLNECKNEKLKKWFKFLKYIMALVAISYALKYYHEELQTERCLLRLPIFLRYAFRPPEKCNFCANVQHVPKVSSITNEEFESKYAYSGVPVIVTDATKNWTALSKFDYWYLRDVYETAKRRQKILDCQFLPYKTGFRNIYEALAMPHQRVELQPDTEPWYFGWSNCNTEIAEILRQHYGKPYFLPNTSENNAVDWFFIGTAGLGAHMHIDNVRLTSWQAQLAGSKRWVLAPPPECYFECNQFEIVVEKGDIIVLDTNRWYHQTFVQPGELSLTIGAEFD